MTTGSVFNNLMGQTSYDTPKVGDGATILMWTDRHAATVIEVSASGKSVTVQEDHAVRTDAHGMSDAQSYDYSPDPNGATRTFTLRKNGAWVQQGSPMRGGTRVGLGYRRHHYDYSF